MGFATELPSPESWDQISLSAVQEEEDYAVSTRKTCSQVQRGHEQDARPASFMSSTMAANRVLELELVPNWPRIGVESQQALEAPVTPVR